MCLCFYGALKPNGRLHLWHSCLDPQKSNLIPSQGTSKHGGLGEISATTFFLFFSLKPQPVKNKLYVLNTRNTSPRFFLHTGMALWIVSSISAAVAFLHTSSSSFCSLFFQSLSRRKYRKQGIQFVLEDLESRQTVQQVFHRYCPEVKFTHELSVQTTGGRTGQHEGHAASHTSLLSLLGDGFEASFAALPLAGEGSGAGPGAAVAVVGRLDCSSLRGSGLGCVGGACSPGGWTVISCCSLWLCRRRSCTRSSRIASCSSWMAWLRCVFLFCRWEKESEKSIHCSVHTIMPL